MQALHTPAGEIVIERSDGLRLPFSVQCNPYSPRIGELLPEETLLLTADAALFEPGCDYRFTLSTGDLHFCGADEDWQALCALHNGCAVGLGAKDPNDGALLYKDWTLRQYVLSTLSDGRGFELHILEKLCDPIVFHAAWLPADGLPVQDCEEALGIWLT